MSIVKKIFRNKRACFHQKSIARAPRTPAPAAARAPSIRTINHKYGNAPPFPLATVSKNL
jgi:hypothetical protein